MSWMVRNLFPLRLIVLSRFEASPTPTSPKGNLYEQTLFQPHRSAFFSVHRRRNSVGWALCRLALLGHAQCGQIAIHARVHDYHPALGNHGRADGRCHDACGAGSTMAGSDRALQRPGKIVHGLARTFERPELFRKWILDSLRA